MDLICPHCDYYLNEFPVRKRKCPGCGKNIIVRTENGEKFLLTPDQAAELDASRKQRAFENKLLEILQSADSVNGNSPARRLYEERLSNSSPSEAAWMALNEIATGYLETADFHSASMCYHAMAFFKRLHDQDFSAEVSERSRLQILDAQKSGYSKVKAWSACSCPACARISGTIQRIKTAFKHPVLPVTSCEKGSLFAQYRGTIDE